MADAKVHAAHCCRQHGCKYTIYDVTCLVVSGVVNQLHPCDQCSEVMESGLPWIMNEMFSLGYAAGIRRSDIKYKNLTGYL